MSTSENISLWKKKAEIDYMPLFISLWFSLNAWMKDRFEGENDRDRLKLLKHTNHPLSDKFTELIYSQDATGNSFRGNFAELHRALQHALIPYTQLENGIISFTSCPITWSKKFPNLESVVKTKYQKGKIKIVEELWVENDTQRLFGAYMEIVYQIRCALFHGDIPPDRDHERVIKQLYLTLSMIMERV